MLDGIGNQPLDAGYFAGGGGGLENQVKIIFFKLTLVVTETISKLPSSTHLNYFPDLNVWRTGSQSPSSAYFAGGVGSGTYRGTQQSSINCHIRMTQ